MTKEMDLIDTDETGANNAHDYTVAELSGAVKRNLEDQFGRIRVRGEVGRVSRPASGHVYFDLKDDRAVLAAICWKGQAARLTQKPEEGLEVIATGKLTTFAGQSKYQLIVDLIEPAGEGALMAQLERRRKALAAEGLFDLDRKRPLPYLPRVIGVITSPSGAVIRDILHRLGDRFPSHVLIWSVAVQGEASPAQVAAAIAGFDALPQRGGVVPRPDLLIVARGGGSLEDLWGFNDEAVVRAAVACSIPLISAVGHETDTTLIDHAADQRAPTPSAAAEMAVPVRAELRARIDELRQRQSAAALRLFDRQNRRLSELSRAMGRPGALTENARQRMDVWGPRLETGLTGLLTRRRMSLDGLRLSGAMLRRRVADAGLKLAREGAQLRPALARIPERRRERLVQQAEKLGQALQRPTREGRIRLDNLTAQHHPTAPRLIRSAVGQFQSIAQRFEAGQRTQRGRLSEQGRQLSELGDKLNAAPLRVISGRRDAVLRLDRMRQSLGWRETLARGFAVVRDPDGKLVATAAQAGLLETMVVEFHDAEIAVRRVDGSDGGPTSPPSTAPKKTAMPKKAPRKAPPKTEQGRLF